jgi:ABC-type sugar transport system permease subunit
LGIAPIAWAAIGVYTAFLLWPVLSSFISSFTDRSPLSDSSSFVGLDNYQEMMSDIELHTSLRFTLLIVVVVTVVANAAGLGFALLLNGAQARYRIMRTLVFIPQVLSGVIVAYIWQVMLTQNGLVNASLMGMNLTTDGVPWLGTVNLSTFSVCVVVSWFTIAFSTVIYAAALQTVPVELYDAARVDGAGAIRRFRYVTWPMIAPGATISVVLSLITGLKLYDIVVVLTGGGPAGTTRTTAIYIIQSAFTENRFGYAAAVAMLLLALTAAFAYGATTLMRKREDRL